jgi:2-polyprenyl-6-methoxyphenol hydroxylase-like FAD-dependent oxidoreductase
MAIAEHDDAGVTAYFFDRNGSHHTTARGDVLIGADGIHSFVRDKLFPNEGPPAWNGLMLTAFAEAANILGRDDYREIAVRNAEFILKYLTRDRRLLRTYKGGQSKLNGTGWAPFENGLTW